MNIVHQFRKIHESDHTFYQSKQSSVNDCQVKSQPGRELHFLTHDGAKNEFHVTIGSFSSIVQNIGRLECSSPKALHPNKNENV